MTQQPSIAAQGTNIPHAVWYVPNKLHKNICTHTHIHTHTQKLVPNCESLENHLFGQYERKSSTDNTHNNKNWEAHVLIYNEKLLSQL